MTSTVLPDEPQPELIILDLIQMGHILGTEALLELILHPEEAVTLALDLVVLAETHRPQLEVLIPEEVHLAP